MDENKILEKLQKETDNVKVPEKLMPDNIMKTVDDVNKNKKNKVINFTNRTVRKMTGLVSAAAILIVALFAYNRIGVNDNNGGVIDSQMTDNNVMVSETVSGYEEIYEKLLVIRDAERSRIEDDEVVNENSITTNGVDMTFAAMGAAGDDFSKTNIQTEGIDEADVIKTDGKYIYHLSSDLHKVSIYAVDGEDTAEVAKIAVPDIGTIEDMYIDEDTLVVTGISFRDAGYQVVLVKYDIADRSNPKEITTFEQAGRSIQTRKIGDIIYLVTQFYVDVENMDKDKPQTYVPVVYSESAQLKEASISTEYNAPMQPDKIYVPEEVDSADYVVITSVDVSKNFEIVDTTAVLGFNGNFYMGTDNMYLYRGINASEIMTDVRKVEYQDGDIGTVTESRILGVIKDAFAINEHNGYLRVMTTSYPYGSTSESVNNVFVLNSDMKIVGSIEGLAKGERIYSARYMGDVAYFVTYKETDPLFSVDLSNPEAPVLMGELKIPGFSEYLHSYGEGKLLGIGVQQSGNSFWAQNIKLSMFDITDPYNVTEEDVVLLEDANDALALHEYKAVMIDPEKNIFGLLTMSYTGDAGYVYRVYTYTENGFEELITHEVSTDVNNYSVRSVYIGDYVYVVDENGITSYTISDN